MTSLDVAGICVAPGTRRRHSIELTELADGTRVSIPLDLVNGARPGPRLYLGAAIHGDEVDGVGILFRALAGVNPKRLQGSIVCVPVQHPLSFHAEPAASRAASASTPSPTARGRCATSAFRRV